MWNDDPETLGSGGWGKLTHHNHTAWKQIVIWHWKCRAERNTIGLLNNSKKDTKTKQLNWIRNHPGDKKHTPNHYNSHLDMQSCPRIKGNHFFYRGKNLVFLEALPQALRTAEKCNYQIENVKFHTIVFQISAIMKLIVWFPNFPMVGAMVRF